MKEYILTAALACILSISCFAQSKTWLTIEAGPNFGNIIQDESNDYESSFDSGFQGGAGFNYRFNPQFRVNAGIGFSQVNVQREYDSDPYQPQDGPQLPPTIPMKYEFMLIDVPVEAGYYLLFGDVQVGFQGGVRSTFVTTVDNDPYFYQDENSAGQIGLDISSNIKSFILVGETGVEIRYSLDENTEAFGGLQLAYDITGIQKNRNGHLFRFGASLGLSINLF